MTTDQYQEPHYRHECQQVGAGLEPPLASHVRNGTMSAVSDMADRQLRAHWAAPRTGEVSA